MPRTLTPLPRTLAAIQADLAETVEAVRHLRAAGHDEGHPRIAALHRDLDELVDAALALSGHSHDLTAPPPPPSAATGAAHQRPARAAKQRTDEPT